MIRRHIISMSLMWSPLASCTNLVHTACHQESARFYRRSMKRTSAVPRFHLIVDALQDELTKAKAQIALDTYTAMAEALSLK
jgi:hypothetical protein